METIPEMNKHPQDDEEKSPANEASDATFDESVSQESIDVNAESEVDNNTETVPDDPDEAIAWLERLAAKQGAKLEELPTVESPTTPANSATESQDKNGLDDVDTGEIPEDPDEAMAWLEMLAAKEVANVDEPEGLNDSKEDAKVTDSAVEMARAEEEVASPLSTDLVEALDASLPNDLDQALGWLEELTEPTVDTSDIDAPLESQVVIEEMPTPAVAHVVDEALAGAEMLFAEPDEEDEPGDAGILGTGAPVDDEDEAMAWLEQLAARQGAPIEELTTIDEVADESVLEDAASSDVVEINEESIDETLSEFQPSREPADLKEELLENEIQIEIRSDENDQLLELSEQELEPHSAIAAVEVYEAKEPAEHLAFELPIAEQEPTEPELEENDELEVVPEDDLSSGDLAWLDTLGAVDAESWLEAEAAVDVEDGESVPQLDDNEDKELLEELGELQSEERTPVDITPDVAGSEALNEARQAMDQGEVDESLSKYAELVESGESLPFVINDLEELRAQREPMLVVQRVLGDAYARNGQLRKAIESYREALANL